MNSTIKKQRLDAGYQYVPIVEYEYSYRGKAYSSSKRRAGNYASGASEEAEAILSRYPVGGRVTVFVDPEDPDNSVLEFGATPLSWICIILGVLVGAGAAGAARMGH